MSYVWGEHDNATPVEETCDGLKLDRYNWTDEEMEEKITAMLTDKKMMRKELKKTSKAMRAQHGPTKAAKVTDALTRRKLA